MLPAGKERSGGRSTIPAPNTCLCSDNSACVFVYAGSRHTAVAPGLDQLILQLKKRESFCSSDTQQGPWWGHTYPLARGSSRSTRCFSSVPCGRSVVEMSENGAGWNNAIACIYAAEMMASMSPDNHARDFITCSMLSPTR